MKRRGHLPNRKRLKKRRNGGWRVKDSKALQPYPKNRARAAAAFQGAALGVLAFVALAFGALSPAAAPVAPAGYFLWEWPEAS